MFHFISFRSLFFSFFLINRNYISSAATANQMKKQTNEKRQKEDARMRERKSRTQNTKFTTKCVLLSARLGSDFHSRMDIYLYLARANVFDARIFIPKSVAFANFECLLRVSDAKARSSIACTQGSAAIPKVRLIFFVVFLHSFCSTK